jgi:AraC-like DNA-binding protein
MKLFLKFDFNTIVKIHIEQLLAQNFIKFKTVTFGEIELLEPLSEEKMADISATLQANGIEIVENQKSVLVQKIKDLIVEMVKCEEPVSVKSSIYLSEKLNHSYGYLSNLFSEITYSSIENFIIIQKIELAKELINTSDMNLTEIAFRLNYSSVAHLSTQFKNTTGITPSAFQRIILKRKEKYNNNK